MLIPTHCPYCGALCEEAECVHNGVGMQQIEGHRCDWCDASEIGGHSTISELLEVEQKRGWFVGTVTPSPPDTPEYSAYKKDRWVTFLRKVGPRTQRFGLRHMFKHLSNDEVAEVILRVTSF